MARRRHPHSIEHNILLTATLCLLAVGAVMVFSASSARTVLSGQGDGTSFLIKYVGYGALGLVLMHVIARRGLELVPKLTGPLLAVAFACLVAVKIPGLGVEVNGARRWLGAGPLVFQPSEVMKLALVLYAAKLLAERPKILRRPQDLAPLGYVAGGAVLLIASQPDLGTSLVICFTMAAMLVAAGMPVRWLMTAGGAGGVLVLLYAMSASYRRDRLMTFLDPWAHAGDEGFQAVQGQIALGSGQLFGRGLGESLQKNLFLPEAHTDFILAIVGEELGVAGVWGILFLYGLVAYAGLRVARNARGTYAKLLAAGVTSLFLSQAMLNVFTILGLAPLTGVPLPFISYGSTNLVVLLLGMGLLLNVAAGGNVTLRAVPAPSARSSRPPPTRRRERRMCEGPGGMPPTIVIAAGGTAGHVVPALAVADALRAEAGAHVVFVGGERAERTLVPEAGYELRTLTVEGLSRTNPLKAARGALKAGAALGAAGRILKELRPDAVMGGGGYVAGPVGAAAVRQRVPLVLTEADSHLGLTNRLLARFARRVCLAFPIGGRDGERYLVTGRPVPPPVTDRAAARARFGLGEGETCVLVFGGSLGARSVNEAAVEGLAGGPFRVLHAAGRRDYDDLRARLGDPPPPGYDLQPYIAPFGDALAAADLTVARAGGSIFEVAAHGVPAILVPYPHAAADHQTANARWMVDAGAAVLLPDAEVSPERLRAEVGALLADRPRLAAMAAASASLARPDAAQAIAAEVLAAA